MPQRLNIFMRVMLIVALTMIGFAHKPVEAAALPASVQYAAYTLPDGTLPVLCVTVTGDEDMSGSAKGAMHSYGCDACRLAASILVPEPPVLQGSAIEFPRKRCAHCRDIPKPDVAETSRALPRAPPAA
ncbi:hypothetical protein [Rhizobium sp. C4]|uniref:hypothetical protein n=1 Tax=Rhizobium sp. C4 TaxID=1349800 RepID=UPI001E36E71C|nr:hypothetical protein [Rhizobium sp. C4]MCD2175550.1 hypothetical protein [Rhizobium sp. C4]